MRLILTIKRPNDEEYVQDTGNINCWMYVGKNLVTWDKHNNISTYPIKRIKYMKEIPND